MNILCTNKKASFKFSLIKKIEAGLSLHGWEVKSIKSGHAQISESYITIKNNEAYLINAHLKVLSTTSESDKANSRRSRKLLLNKRELISISNEIKQNGYTLVPTKMYTKKSLIKLEIAIAKGKQAHDKRADIKNREWERNKDRILKNR
ncbi:MAG: SsrA-binding protein SmpB [Gammaproteobacteria bacterium]|jgi:SsrA-binding protein|nr:SsrA-binding protein SmpB [Gammaproteobacteria bacterium]|tara:strand:+ start:73 stop:519 length:447 start_codon:yes stop_codon:yes gene_type:complete